MVIQMGRRNNTDLLLAISPVLVTDLIHVHEEVGVDPSERIDCFQELVLYLFRRSCYTMVFHSNPRTTFDMRLSFQNAKHCRFFHRHVESLIDEMSKRRRGKWEALCITFSNLWDDLPPHSFGQ
jgi:hypothetical protein